MPRIEEMIKKEKRHLVFMINMRASNRLIKASKNRLAHYVQRLVEYKNHVE